MSDHDELRRMVREVLREVLPREAARSAELSAAQPVAQPVVAPASASSREPSGPDVRRVRVRDDHDLADLVTQVLNLAEDPRRAADLRTGRIRFALTHDDHTEPSEPGPIEVRRGALTERLVQRAAREQRALHLGPGAVVTPLARDRARALGVAIHRTDGRETR